MITEEGFAKLMPGDRVWDEDGRPHTVTRILEPPKRNVKYVRHIADKGLQSCEDEPTEPSMSCKDDSLQHNRIPFTVFPDGNCTAGVTVQTEGIERDIFWSQCFGYIVDKDGNPIDLLNSSGASCGSPAPVTVERLWSTPPPSKS